MGPGPLGSGLEEFGIGVAEVVEALTELDGALATKLISKSTKER